MGLSALLLEGPTLSFAPAGRAPLIPPFVLCYEPTDSIISADLTLGQFGQRVVALERCAAHRRLVFLRVVLPFTACHDFASSQLPVRDRFWARQALIVLAEFPGRTLGDKSPNDLTQL